MTAKKSVRLLFGIVFMFYDDIFSDYSKTRKYVVTRARNGSSGGESLA